MHGKAETKNSLYCCSISVAFTVILCIIVSVISRSILNGVRRCNTICLLAV